MNKIAIVILTYNNLEYTKACLESIRKYTERGTYEIVIVDNNSTDDTRQWLLEQGDIKVKFNNENMGFPRGCNMGIGLAEANSDILLLNNDTIVTTRWLENLRNCLYSNNSIGAVGAVSLSTANQQGVDFTYENFDVMQELAERNNISNSNRWEEKLKLIGFCLLIRRSALEQVGRLDERYSPGYYEDDDLGLKLIEAGYKLMLCHDCFIHHYLGTSFRKDKEKFWRILNENQRKFTLKWGFSTLSFDELRGDLQILVDEADKTRELNILEIGCKLGVNLLKIKYKYPNAKLYGTEMNNYMAKFANKVATVLNNNPNEFPLDFRENFFDYIFIGNYIEIVDNPVKFLNDIKKYLKKDGSIICGFQNVMHFSVIRDLLDGKWFYGKGEILSKSNKNKFASEDIYSLFRECGYKTPYIFHWYSWASEEEERFIKILSNKFGQDKEHLYRAYSYAVKAQRDIT